MKLGKKEARHLLDALSHLRKAVIIAQMENTAVGVSQLALERCIEIADEALQREGVFAATQIDEALILKLSQLRYMISRDYDLVDPVVLRAKALTIFPELIGKIEAMEDELYRLANLKRPPSSSPS